MTTDPSAPALDGSTQPLPAYVPHLPVLRRPPGWSVLEEPALRVRAAQLFHALATEVPGARPGAVPAASTGQRPTGWDTGREAASVTAADAADARRAGNRVDGPRGRPGRRWLELSLMLLLLGLVVVAPWLAWAPLAGGLCLGILLLHTGYLDRWMSSLRNARTDAEEASADSGEASGQAERGIGRASDGAGAVPVAPVQGLETSGLRFTHSGWLLAAALVLVGVQAAIVIATVQIRRSDPSLQAGAARGAPASRAAEADAALRQPWPLPQAVDARRVLPQPDDAARPEETRQ